MKKYLLLSVAAILSIISISACSGSSNGATARDQKTSTAILGQFEQSQPVPQFKWSQIRQTAIDVETAQAKTTQTTTFFFNQGVTDPVQSCPSIGFPVAATTQLTNPQQVVGNNRYSLATIGQIDPNGVYSGDSTGTYVLCVDRNGQTYGAYWEGFVFAITGPAVWNTVTHDIKMTGPSSFAFTTK